MSLQTAIRRAVRRLRNYRHRRDTARAFNMAGTHSANRAQEYHDALDRLLEYRRLSRAGAWEEVRRWRSIKLRG